MKRQGSRWMLRLAMAGMWLSALASADAADKTSLAVWELNAGPGVSADEAQLLTDTVRAKLIKTDRFRVMAREESRRLVEEQDFQSTASCDEAQCLVEVGKILAVGKMVGGSIGRLGDTYNLSLKLVDVETSEIEKMPERRWTGRIDDAFDQMEAAVYELAGLSLPASVAPSTPAAQRDPVRPSSLVTAADEKARLAEEQRQALREKMVAILKDFEQHSPKEKFRDRLYVSPDISSEALFRVKSLCQVPEDEEVFGLLWSGNGVLLGGRGIYWCNPSEACPNPGPHYCSYGTLVGADISAAWGAATAVELNNVWMELGIGMDKELTRMLKAIQSALRELGY